MTNSFQPANFSALDSPPRRSSRQPVCPVAGTCRTLGASRLGGSGLVF